MTTMDLHRPCEDAMASCDSTIRRLASALRTSAIDAGHDGAAADRLVREVMGDRARQALPRAATPTTSRGGAAPDGPLPCPFCGTAAAEVGPGLYSCGTRGAKLPEGYTCPGHGGGLILQIWNRRPAPSAKAAEGSR